MNELEQFIEMKRENSEFLTLLDGETVKIEKLINMKPSVKPGRDGKPKDVLNFLVEVKTSRGTKEKTFSGTNKFVKECIEKGIQVGCGFSITRHGAAGATTTFYTVSDVTGV